MAFTVEFKEKLTTDVKTIAPFVERIYQITVDLTGSKEEAHKVKLALEEALSNAIRHGNKMDPSRHVHVFVCAGQEKIILDVHDEGDGFDHLSIPDPTVEPHSNKPSGRGVYLMRKLMSQVDFYDQGRGIRMTKIFNPASP
jgi:serine/threonine-protein kinase RsbW